MIILSLLETTLPLYHVKHEENIEIIVFVFVFFKYGWIMKSSCWALQTFQFILDNHTCKHLETMLACFFFYVDICFRLCIYFLKHLHLVYNRAQQLRTKTKTCWSANCAHTGVKSRFPNYPIQIVSFLNPFVSERWQPLWWKPTKPLNTRTRNENKSTF